MHTLSLPHGELALPAFFPDGTHGAVRCLDACDLVNCAVPGLVMNTYHLLVRPGVSTIKALGGLNRFCGWNRPILSDSGGFQVFSLIRENAKYGEIRKHEIVFYPDNGGGKMLLTPEKCIQAQFAFGSDIMMCLDYCTHPDDPPEVNELSVSRTIEWARRCRSEYDKLIAARGNPSARRPLIFGIIQGGGDVMQRRLCAKALIDIGFDGFGFGGWPLDGEGKLLVDILRETADLMPGHLPKYAMGLGRPEEIVSLVDMGYTLFDCVIPTREARHGRLYLFDEDISPAMLRAGRFYRFYYIADDKHFRDDSPVSVGCDCHLCRHYSRAYLRHLYKVGDSLAYRLATIHNVRFYSRLMELLRGEA